MHYHCTLITAQDGLSSTCAVMTNVADFITVFLANVTNQPELTPACTVTGSFCHHIECLSADGSQYTVGISPCASPPSLNLEIHRPQTSTFGRTYVANSRVIEQFSEHVQFQVTMSYEMDTILLEVSACGF